MTKFIAIGVLSLLLSDTAARAGVLYTLEDVNFTNGTAASGSFQYCTNWCPDPITVAGFTNIDITISGPVPTLLFQYLAFGGTLFVDSDAPDLTGADFLQVSFNSSLYQGEGSYLAGNDPIAAAYGTCTDSTCSTTDTVAVTPGPGEGSGALVTTDPGAYQGSGSSTPEPTTVLLAVTGTLLLIAKRKKRGGAFSPF